ncbi:MAG: DUF5606 domain-containing protein [Chitinophagales bacterium]|jgi:hypothetical protein
MEFREIIAVTGVAGLKRLVANRNDGLILSELDGSNKKFYSNRQHMFSPLENIAIYTDNDTVPLLDVFIEMKNQKAANAPVDPNAANDVLRNYLGSILPNFDRERVNISDIKKLIKWFAILENLDVIKKSETPAAEEAKVAAKKEVAPAKTKAPAKDVVVQKQSVAKPRMTKNKV